MMQHWFAGSDNALNAAATEYNAPWHRDVFSWASGENGRRQLCAGTGKIHSFKVKLSASPGGSGRYVFNLRLNKVTQLIASITEPATEAADYTEFDVTAGDLLSVQCVPSLFPSATPLASWSFIYQGDNENEYLVMGGHSNNMHVTNTERNYLSGGDTWTGDVDTGNNYQDRQAFPHTGTVQDLYVELNGTPDPGTYLFEVIQAGGSSFGATVGLGATTANNTGSTITVAQDDLFYFRVNPDSTPNTRDAYWGTTFISDDAYEHAILGGSKNNLPSTASTEYNFINASDNSWTATETNRRVLGQCSTMHNIRVEISGTIPIGNTFVFTLMKNGSSTGLTVTKSNPSTTQTDAYVEIADGDLLSLEVTLTGAAMAIALDAAWGFSVLNVKPFMQSLGMMGSGI